MHQPIDLSNFHRLTGGDAAIESQLFQIFIDSSAACIDGLAKACADNDDSAWRHQAHALCGICRNIGADHLAALCQQAQNNFTDSVEEKQKMLLTLRQELKRVIDVLPRESPTKI